MAEFVHQFHEPFVDGATERQFSVRVYADQAASHWEGWIEFYPLDEGPSLRTGRETEQGSRPQLAYWATGLSGLYLEGAFKRARGNAEHPAPSP